MDVFELLTKSLEDAEFDIYHAADAESVEEIRRKSLADIYGAKEAGFFTGAEADSWKKRIKDVSTFRWASFEWRENA